MSIDSALCVRARTRPISPGPAGGTDDLCVVGGEQHILEVLARCVDPLPGPRKGERHGGTGTTAPEA